MPPPPKEVRVVGGCRMPERWQSDFVALTKEVTAKAAEASRRGGGKTDLREAFVRLLKKRIEEKFGGVWQCFVGKKFAFNVRSNTASDYSHQMIICEVPMGGSSHHLLAYRSPPTETTEQQPEPEPEPAQERARAGSKVVQVVHSDMPGPKKDQIHALVTDIIVEMRAGRKPEEAQVDDSQLASEIKGRIQSQLRWSPTWHVITGAEKLSGWDSAISAEPGTRYSAISRPIKVEIFRHNEAQLLPAEAVRTKRYVEGTATRVGNWGCWRVLTKLIYVCAITLGLALVWLTFAVEETQMVSLEPLAGLLRTTFWEPPRELPQPVACTYAQLGAGCCLLLAVASKVPAQLSARRQARTQKRK